MAQYNLTAEQLIVFIEWVWNTRLYNFNPENFWIEIARLESERTFQEGWNFCESSLSFSPRKGWEWSYETTSGTVLKASQCAWEEYNEETSTQIRCSVIIPDSRDLPGRTHHAYMMIALENLPYFHWGGYCEEDSLESIRIMDILSGKTKDQRDFERASKAEDRANSNRGEDLEDDDYEDYEASNYEEDDE
jgi:hypothetical protein